MVSVPRGPGTLRTEPVGWVRGDQEAVLGYDPPARQAGFSIPGSLGTLDDGNLITARMGWSAAAEVRAAMLALGRGPGQGAPAPCPQALGAASRWGPTGETRTAEGGRESRLIPDHKEGLRTQEDASELDAEGDHPLSLLLDETPRYLLRWE